jgi:radical SAM/Cys-rich protein
MYAADDFVDVATLEAGPKRSVSLRARRVPLASPETQLARLDALRLDGGDFEARLAETGREGLYRLPLEYFQINVGKLCNMTCRHCHVDAGPDRTDEQMSRETAEACVDALRRTTAHTVDITGGAPELNPHFEYLVEQSVAAGRAVIDRCNLTVLLLPRMRHMPEWLGERGVEVVCSLPHWRVRNTDAQRGDGTFVKSIAALRLLNAAGYGRGDPRRRLTLVSNPAGAFLAGSQAAMEREWRAGLEREHGVRFDRLICLNNMPIARYLEWLEDTDNLAAYMARLTAAFNPATIDGLMCRNTLSVAWDGRLYDCDFNQMLDLPVATGGHIADFDPARLQAARIVTARHCFGCTAGAGSSCGGATAGG